MAATQRTIPTGSWVLVVGAASFLASHIIKEFLALGYKVRGTDYDIQTSSFLADELFRSEAASGSFEFVHVPRIVEKNALENAMKGVSAVIFIANTGTGPDPYDIIPQNISAITNALETAGQEPSIVRFVHTSSGAAAYTPLRDSSNVRIDATSWNDAAEKLAWTPPFNATRPPIVYMASKSAAEKAMWKFVEEKKPNYVVNTVLPFFMCGKLLSKQQNPSSTMFVRMLYEGDTSILNTYETYSYVNVRDVALIHVAATLDPEVISERIFAVGEHSNWNDMLAIMRNMYPERKFMDDLSGLPRFTGTVDVKLASKLLKTWGQQDGWVSLEQGVREYFAND